MKRAVKLSSPMAYRIVRHLLTHPVTTQLQVSREMGVSIGWVNAVVKTLHDSNVVAKGRKNRVELIDPIPLLDRMAWESPLSLLHLETVNLETSDVAAAESALKTACSKTKTKYALTAFSGLSRYLAYYISHPTVHAYVSDPSVGRALVRGRGGVSIELLSAAPEVLEGARKIGGFSVVQPIQVVIDLFRLGAAGRDAAVKLYERIRSGRA